MENQQTAIVTGGAGFLGSHLCDRLLEDGFRVICIDSLLTGSLDNIAHLVDRPDFQFIQHDIIQPLHLPGRVDRIYNLACPASPAKYTLDPVHTFNTSVIGGQNMLNMALDKGARILQASTSEVYGDPSVRTQSEDYRGNVNTVGPRSCYDEGKRAAETLFHDFRQRYGLITKIVRIFNTYGPRMSADDGRVVSNFIVQALRGEDITIYGDGEQTRSFCYVEDLIRGMCRMMDTPDEIAGPVNLGNPEEYTVNELAQMILRKTGSSSKLTYRDRPIDDPYHRRPDITLARELLNCRPRVDISEGLDLTIAYFRDLLLGPGQLRVVAGG
ncbi:UDP-glucuronic acid decarboxylase family protein [Actibacterium sp. MT2.3-13A]|uniref:UDP-glucuronic acid decarboxylase family protein n=1 Tax=Actibacterium sp. MT2.3-13A TaxID=2828332 RepID=UPI001BAC8E6F|nr:UDP-glucuronic acid decarboxylase family protein [Actibacterium sp. MT2.3-13A]